METDNKPVFYVIVYATSNGMYCVSIAHKGPGEHVIVARSEVPASVEAALQRAEEHFRERQNTGINEMGNWYD